MKARSLAIPADYHWFTPAPNAAAVPPFFKRAGRALGAALALLLVLPVAAVVLATHLIFPSEEHW